LGFGLNRKTGIEQKDEAKSAGLTGTAFLSLTVSQESQKGTT
jgi:hypothetical protein